ncbi:uncharacterized protein LOC113013907 [Astatotilapia calliptera]|uniref:uncharacterized protein LOC113013907 n=1 Tax=Astatotilapia calliptera TaxID=8154 RepID=UPI000E4184A8|nr:uncharacterized protein LOC113013907 [Astatotilapia calliptera]
MSGSDEPKESLNFKSEINKTEISEYLKEESTAAEEQEETQLTTLIEVMMSPLRKPVISNKVVVKQQPNWPQIFRGETITLTCEVQEGGETTEWEYKWRGPRTLKVWTRNNDVTFRVSESSSGDYMCKSRRRDDSYSSTEWSEAFTLSASKYLFYFCLCLNSTADHPKAQITIDVRDIPVGGSVTLSCSVNSSSGWKFYWYRDVNSSEPLTTQDAVQMQMQFPSVGQISVSQEGLYRCRGGRGHPVYYTEYSDPLIIDENDMLDPELHLLF